MPASTPEALYDFETNIEGAFSGIFTGALTQRMLTVQVVTSRDPESKITPRYEIKFSLNTPASLQKTTIGQANPRWVDNSFIGTLQVTLATQRTDSSNNSELHGRLRGLARYLCSGIKVFDNTNMPYYQILLIKMSGNSQDVYNEKREDRSIFSYDITFGIQDSAWPSNT